MTSSQFKHPVLRLDVLDENGVARHEHRVFCRLQRSSVLVEECCSCLHCDEIKDGPNPTVNCTMPIPPDDPAKDPAGDTTEIGTLLCCGTVVIAASSPLTQAFTVLHTEGRRSVPIVDSHHVLVGILHDTGFLGRRLLGKDSVITAAMSSAVALHERTPVRTALKFLAANHLREATVVSDEGKPIGVFRDIDGLHWLTLARGSEPLE
ncbi:MAG: CBS domain-containing protein [Deltaproteobacteria bacterium]|nr:CBS domain-containing protein [Deltaproteobacteria bacterium]